MQDFEGRAKWELLWRVVTFFLQEEINNFLAGKRFCFADKDPRPPRIRLKITCGFRTFFRLLSSHTNPDLHRLIRYDDRCYDICEYPAARTSE